MANIETPERRSPGATTSALGVCSTALACLVLAACGSSSTSSSSTTATAASAPSSTPSTAAAPRPGSPSTPGAPGQGFAALRQCLQKNGIVLPKAGAPTGAPGLGGAAGGFQLPKGVTQAQFQAAIKKCGGGTGRFRPGTGARGALGTPAAKQALTAFAACMREGGIKVGAPNTSGNGPIFNTSAINTATPQFKAAEAKCAPIIRGALAAQAGGAGAAPPGGTGAAPPPAG